MFEEIVTRILVRYLGDFVEGINKEQLRFSLLEGKVEIHDLRFKTSGLKKLRLPVEVKEGVLGKLVLLVPWSQLGTERVLVQIERLFLVVAPKENVEETVEETIAMLQEEKQERLRKAELKAFEFLENKKSDKGIFAHLIEKVVGNLQINIKDVHIRYEDDRTDPKSPFAFGITLQEISVCTTDQDWNPTFLNTTTSITNKLLELKNLSLYWNNKNPELGLSTTNQDIFQKMIFCDSDEPQWQHQHILEPVSGFLKVRVNNDKERDLDTPKYSFQFHFKKIKFGVDSTQYSNLMKLVQWLDAYRSQDQKRRKSVVLRNDVLDETETRLYQILYKLSKSNAISPEERKGFDAFEQRLSYETIISLRAPAQQDIVVENQKQRENQKGYISSAYENTTYYSGAATRLCIELDLGSWSLRPTT